VLEAWYFNREQPDQEIGERTSKWIEIVKVHWRNWQNDSAGFCRYALPLSSSGELTPWAVLALFWDQSGFGCNHTRESARRRLLMYLTYGDLVECRFKCDPVREFTLHGPGYFWSENVNSLAPCTSSNDAMYSAYYNTKTIKMYGAGNRQQAAMDYSGRSRSKILCLLQKVGLTFRINLQQIIDGVLVHEHFLFHFFHCTKTWLTFSWLFFKNCVYTQHSWCLWRDHGRRIISMQNWKNPHDDQNWLHFYPHGNWIPEPEDGMMAGLERWDVACRAIWRCQRLGWGAGDVPVLVSMDNYKV